MQESRSREMVEHKHSGSYCHPWGDNGDGTYNNPILPADFSDPDILRVGNDYFLIASTFQLSPGLTVLHSSDLVNWKYIGAAVADITALGTRFAGDKCAGYVCGIWSPCLTYQPRTRTFYIHFGTPDEGMFMVKTKNIYGPWSRVYEVTKPDGAGFGDGWDDCGVLWDDDGQGYFLLTHFRGNYQGWLHKLADDGQTLQDAGVPFHHSFDSYSPLEGMPEANKIFKKDGIYYFLHNGCNFVGDDPIRKAWMMRSPYIYGAQPDGSPGTFANPGRYEHCPHPIVEGFREPCQGNLVDAATPGGTRWYFLTHHGKMGSLGSDSGALGVDGRRCSLLPVEWIDNWPVVADSTTRGQMIWKNLAKPFPHSIAEKLLSSDDGRLILYSSGSLPNRENTLDPVF
ncbi:MAG: family 43 glycosylhydrolase [Verrucomicrobiae bacterium]